MSGARKATWICDHGCANVKNVYRPTRTPTTRPECGGSLLCRVCVNRTMGYHRSWRGRGDIKRNAAQGKRAECMIRQKYRNRGYDVRPTGVGHDFKATRYGMFGGRKTKFVEVKSGNSQLSPTQWRARERLGYKYVIERVPAYKVQPGHGRGYFRRSY